jgi:hypothetical protein
MPIGLVCSHFHSVSPLSLPFPLVLYPARSDISFSGLFGTFSLWVAIYLLAHLSAVTDDVFFLPIVIPFIHSYTHFCPLLFFCALHPLAFLALVFPSYPIVAHIAPSVFFTCILMFGGLFLLPPLVVAPSIDAYTHMFLVFFLPPC